MTLTLHRGPVLLPSMLDVGLPQQVDHYPGTRSVPSTRRPNAWLTDWPATVSTCTTTPGPTSETRSRAPERPSLAHRPRLTGPEPSHLDRHRHRSRRHRHRQSPWPGPGAAAYRLRSPPCRGGMCSHRLRHPWRHRRCRGSQSRGRHEPQSRLRCHDPRSSRQPRPHLRRHRIQRTGARGNKPLQPEAPAPSVDADLTTRSPA